MKMDKLDTIGYIDDQLVEKADKYFGAKKRNTWIKWGAMAACLCLVIGGLVAITRPAKAPLVISGELPKIAIPEYVSGGAGFEGVMCYSAEELGKGNPWRKDAALNTLPVFKNGSYDPSGAGVPLGLSETKMIEKLEGAAKALGLEILDTEAETNSNGTVYSICAITEKGDLTIYANGSLEYDLPHGYKLPEGYHFTYSNTSDSEAEAAMDYLTETYASFLNYDYPEIVLQGHYTFSGDYVRSYGVYDSGTDMTERILNYNFCGARFSPDDSGNLWLINIGDGLCMAEKLGDYPLISVAEAKEKLLAGQYQTNVPVAMPGKKYIAKVELVYRSGPMEETLLPYYRFYAELQDADGWEMTQSNGLKTYGAYYVPAIQDDYISNLSTYNGHFN